MNELRLRSLFSKPTSWFPKTAEPMLPVITSMLPTARCLVSRSFRMNGARRAFHTTSRPPKGATKDCGAKL